MRTPHASARIINHSHGHGVTSPDDIYQRASELAIIDGRSADDITESDLEEARREMTGGHVREDAGDEPAYIVGSDLVGHTLGHHVANHIVDESENAVIELVQEGMEEAEHDQMLAASRAIRDEDL